MCSKTWQNIVSCLDKNDKCKKRPFISLVLAGYNEEPILEKNLLIIIDYLKSIEKEYTSEIIFVNDGSQDNTGIIADKFARTRSNVKVIHHKVNMHLGCALRTGINVSKGQYIVTMDLDLSYSVEYIKK